MLAAGSLSQDTGASGKLFKRRTNRAKKGIHANTVGVGLISVMSRQAMLCLLFLAVSSSDNVIPAKTIAPSSLPVLGCMHMQ
ncbi:hypothetical protein BASA62_002405 [Batrachochytrium salamandrivorans]|nr:hypothetical protein BASA62_002405 [Batrachochytrium salamandrivorans]